MQYILLVLVYFLDYDYSRIFHYSLSCVQKGVGPWRGQLLPYMHRKSCKELWCCNPIFVFEEVGF
jgi:hypothetical protein